MVTDPLIDPDYIRTGPPPEALAKVHRYWMVETPEWGWREVASSPDGTTMWMKECVTPLTILRSYPCREDSPLPVPWPTANEGEAP